MSCGEERGEGFGLAAKLAPDHGVSMKPGATALARMPSAAYSIAGATVSWSTAALLAM